MNFLLWDFFGLGFDGCTFSISRNDDPHKLVDQFQAFQVKTVMGLMCGLFNSGLVVEVVTLFDDWCHKGHGCCMLKDLDGFKNKK